MAGDLRLAWTGCNASLEVPTYHRSEQIKHLVHISTLSVPPWRGTAHGRGHERCERCELNGPKG
eukprot:816349-Prymnesium_polylepis.2